MICRTCLRTLAKPRPAMSASAPRPRISASARPRVGQQARSISLLTPRRPQLAIPLSFSSSSSSSSSLPSSLAVLPRVGAPSQPVSHETLDVMPKISTSPLLAGMQVRSGPRDTYNMTHFKRKRRHGFLARIRTRKGRAILARRRAKGRKNLSH